MVRYFNIRELKNVIERAAIITDSNEVDEDCILFSFEAGKSRKAIGPTKNNHLSNQYLKNMLAVYEKQLLETALKKAPSIRKTAALLNVSHVTLLNKLKKHDIRTVRKWTNGN